MKYPSSGNYDPNLNCYFKLIVPDGKKVKITFSAFNFQAGVDYSITLNSVTADPWCHGNYDFLQIDQKTMKDYANNESAQNRFCGTSTPPVYTSDSNMLIIWMKTNSD